MIRKRNEIYFLVFLLSAALFSSCRNKVTITRDYIYSTSWAKGEYQGFQITKIKLKDSTVSISDKNFNHYFLDEHILDSNFCFIEISQTGRELHEKIYFDKDDAKRKWRSCWNGLIDVRKVIGRLELNTWYLITGLYGTEDFYVYIDNGGGSHTYSLGPTNW